MTNYSQIFTTQEFKVILGKKNSNFWILFAVFVLTIGSLSFSRAGLHFLKQKMEDPFINWIDVSREPRLDDLYHALENADNQEKYHYSTIEKNIFILEYVFNSDDKKLRVEGRTIEDNSTLFDKILSDENVVVKRKTAITSEDYGWVVTKDLMNRLGYGSESQYPLFVNLAVGSDDVEVIEKLGIENFNRWQKTPIPIVAVVKQLPDVLDFLATPCFSKQCADDSRPFVICNHPEYFDRIQIVVDADKEKNVKADLQEKLADFELEWEKSEACYLTFRDAKIINAIVREDYDRYAEITRKCNEIIANSKTPIYRYFDYEFSVGRTLNPDYISIMFNDLSKVKQFQQFAKEEFDIRIDMAQVDAKENFQTFNNLATLLCAAIIAISIFFVVIFLYFLINAHFQKISKNLGTIMAFGLDNKNIIKIYLSVFMKLIAAGIISAIVLLSLTQLTLWMFGCGYTLNSFVLPYLNMCDIPVIAVILSVMALSAVVTYYIMNKKLKSTPGDLIYERNSH